MPFLARHALFVVAVLCSLLSPARAQNAVLSSANETSPNRAATSASPRLPGAILVEASDNPKTQEANRKAAIVRARISNEAKARVMRQLRAIGALGPRTPLRQPRILAYTRTEALPVRSIPQAAAAVIKPAAAVKPTPTPTPTVVPRPTPGHQPPPAVAPLRFKFTSFTPGQTSDFNSFAAKAYPLMTALYGDPAPAQRGRIVEIKFDKDAGDGLYEPPTANTPITSGGVISYYPIFPDDQTLSADEALRLNEYNLLRQMLLSFHGARLLAFDAWELGMSDAAALLVAYQMHQSAAFNPSLLGVYLLPIYDILNTPELGNPIFFSRDASINLAYFRAGMAQAAWLKVYVENHSVFKNFNASYYSGFAWNGPLFNEDITKLKAIVASFVPNVEGLPFNDWYAKQTVLDTTATVGEKLWIVIVPYPDLVVGDTRSVFVGIGQHFRTIDTNGNEVPVGGSGKIRAYDETGKNITLLSNELRAINGDQLVFNTLGEAEFNGQNVPSNETPIVGFDNTGTPERARLRIEVTISPSLVRDAIFPYGVAGTETAPSGYYGAIKGSRKGTLAVTGRSAGLPVERGAFSDAGNYPSNDGNVTTFTFTPQDGSAAGTWKRNGMWSYSDTRSQSFAVILEGTPVPISTKRTFAASGTNKWRLISLPLVPTKSDEADVLGVARASLALARYRGDSMKVGFSESGIPFEITTARHAFYPKLGAPFAPGRGYWLQLDKALSTSVEGHEPARSGDYGAPLGHGWNTVGVPFKENFALAALKVRYQGTTVPYAEAVGNGWIGAGVWRWKAEGGYDRVDSGEAENQKLMAYEGYYLWCGAAEGAELLFPPKSATTDALPQAPATAQNWRLPFTVSSDSARDDSAAFGVTTWSDGKPMTRAAAKPPGGPRSLTLAFFSSGNAATDAAGAGVASGWAECLQAPAASLTARGLVDGASKGQTVTVSWTSLGQLPVQFDAVLTDEISGQKTDMAKTRYYRFLSDGTARRFRIEATERATGILTLTARQLGGSRLVELAASFGVGGRATLDIENADGDLVRNIAVVEKGNAGARKWSWGGLDAAGRAVAAGTYVAHLHFLDDRGVETEKSVTFVLK